MFTLNCLLTVHVTSEFDSYLESSDEAEKSSQIITQTALGPFCTKKTHIPCIHCGCTQLWLAEKLSLDNIYIERPLQLFYGTPTINK